MTAYEFPCPPGTYDDGALILSDYGNCATCVAGTACGAGSGTGAQLEP
jgi:hypothetical protein